MSVPVRGSPWPARFDLLQSTSGLVLGLFMWLHMVFVASILLGADAMWAVARFFEGYFLFGHSLPWLISLLVAGISGLFVVHAWLALRKFPAQWQQHVAFWGHMRGLRHGDTTLWLVQVVTGFGLLFLAPVHLYGMLTHPDLIGPYASADRVWSGHLWPLYLFLLLLVEVHAGIGLYRLAVKWVDTDPSRRRRLKTIKWTLTALFLALGLVTLGAYARLGIAHAPDAGERYVPTWLQEGS